MPDEREYEEILDELERLLEGETDRIARMATICAHLKLRIPAASWVGFYRVVAPRMLAAGPYQGGIGCLRIPFERGVCGAAARTGRSQVVDDVHSFEGHIACDALARSELVVPVLGPGGELLGVLDLDSRESAAFGEVDRRYLERCAGMVDPSTEGEGTT